MREPSVPIVKLDGTGGSLELWPAKVTLRHRGTLTAITKGFTGNKDIFLSSVTGIQLKQPSWLTSGFIQIQYMGSHNPKGSMFKTAADENTLYFTGTKRFEIANQLKAEAERRIHELSNTPMSHPVPPMSTADEIAKLVTLRDQGILNTGELEDQKRRPLNRINSE